MSRDLKKPSISRRRLSLLWAGVLMAATPAVGADLPPEDPFPFPESIAGQVDFWIRVFSDWGVSQVAVHDMDYPAIVYETVDLPGPTEFPYTKEQKDFVDGLRESWESRLEALERELESGTSLTDDQKGLFMKIATNAGIDAVRDAHLRVRTQRGLRDRFRRGIEIGEAYMKTFRGIFREKGLPEDLAYLPHVESSFQSSAMSSAGAVGIWQFTRGTGRKFLTINSILDERLDPVAATRGAAEYFRKAYDLLGDWALAVTSYNHGLQGMQSAKESFGTDFARIQREYRSRSFGFASQNFYAEFLAARRIAREPDRYFPEGLTTEPDLELDHVVLKRRASPGRIAQVYGVPLEDLVPLNTSWSRRTVRRGYALPTGTNIWLPPGTLARVARERAEGVFHVVRRGETLSTIALRFGSTVDELRGMNGIPPNESLIRVGQKLRVKTPAEIPPEPATHVVRRGEALSTIALLYDLTVAELRSLNGIPAGSSLIRPGQELRVSGEDDPPLTHVVRRGETLTKIAATHGVRLDDLLATNRLSRTTVIYPGQELHIPAR